MNTCFNVYYNSENMKHMNIKWLLRFAFLNFLDRPLRTFNVSTSYYQSKLKIFLAYFGRKIRLKRA